MKKFRKNSGITLIALVITVIVLLILAGVAIETLTGENGLLTKTQEAKNKTEEAQEKEKIEMAVMGASIISNGQSNILDSESFRRELENQFGESGFYFEENGDGSFLIKVEDTQRRYYVNDDKTVISNDNIVEISDSEGLIEFKDEVNSGNSYEGKVVLLTSDITLSGEWEPIGYYDQATEDIKYPDTKDNKPFKGIFDGKNNEINGITITSSDEICHGLFGLVIDGTIRNIIIGKNNNISGNGRTAGVVGYLYGFKGNINNCVNYANIAGGNTTGGIVGAIVGQHTIYNCKNYGDITGLGGIVGGSNGTDYPQEFDDYSHKIINCGNYGTVKSIGLNYAGGIAGYLKGRILNCCNKGAINGGNSTGGIAGGVDGGVENCYNLDDVNGNFAGGIFNESSTIGGNAINCYSTGTVTGTNSGDIMCFEDLKRDKIVNCYTKNDIFAAEDLGNAFKNDSENINGGYPMLYWE